MIKKKKNSLNSSYLVIICNLTHLKDGNTKGFRSEKNLSGSNNTVKKPRVQLYNTCRVTIAERCVQTDVRQLSPPHMLLLTHNIT
jgi:hypothetical protein